MIILVPVVVVCGVVVEGYVVVELSVGAGVVKIEVLVSSDENFVT